MGTVFNPISGEIMIIPDVSNLIGSYPEDTEYRIANMYLDPATDKVMVNYADSPGGEDESIPSAPPSGSCRILNLYVGENGRTWVSYDENPI